MPNGLINVLCIFLVCAACALVLILANEEKGPPEPPEGR